MSSYRKDSPFLDQVRRTIRTRHYSIRTEHAYVDWVKRFIIFNKKRHPRDMAEAEVSAFLSWLAVARQVSAATQNQALNALVFMYKHVVGKPLGDVVDAVREKRPRRLPVVLTREEVGRLLRHLDGPYWLPARLLYGSGLRLMECLRLRVKDLEKDVRTTQIYTHVLQRGANAVVSPLAEALSSVSVPKADG